MRKGFTLIEILIVIIIIGVLMTVTMQFGSKRIDDLGYQAGREQFLSAYDKLYSQAMTSNYHEGIRYDQLIISLTSGDTIAYAISQGNQTETFGSPVAGLPIINSIRLDSGFVEAVNLVFTPYVLGCDIIGMTTSSMSTGVTANISLLVKGQKQYCFSIKNDTCKLIEQKCE